MPLQRAATQRWIGRRTPPRISASVSTIEDVPVRANWFQEAILDVWDSWRFTLLETTEASEGKVFVVESVTGRGKGSGVETTQHFWSVLWLRSGLVCVVRCFSTKPRPAR